jgi:peptidoglycan DL-endopeptidase CwlO
VFKWLVTAAAIIAAAFPLTFLFLVGAASTSQAGTGTGGRPSALAQADIPPAYLAWYLAAAPTCAGLPWGVLAGIGKVESDHGRSAAPGVHSGANLAGAEGPMQFLPATFARFAVNADHGRPLRPYDPADAIFTAAAMLCADGAATGTNAGIRQAVFAYNHSRPYVSHVLSWAVRYTVRVPPGAAASAVAVALAQVGKPYRWGAAGPDAFDCSGLVFAAYAAAGIAIGRTTFQWHQDGPPVPLSQLQPGDLLFSAGSEARTPIPVTS